MNPCSTMKTHFYPLIYPLNLPSKTISTLKQLLYILLNCLFITNLQFFPGSGFLLVVPEQDEFFPVTANSEPEALEDTFNRQQDGGSTVTASGGDVDVNHMELSTSFSGTEGLHHSLLEIS
ncbi:uncharacterized protein LOC123904928 [Trifolium pratense]|uniref:uncharacterized protein LOC123904928 n=1 Tax=Trifolium pratense TaxID=57577 RepID=UPI001E696F9C|nr:uncharacterized protein LOC123904928 [Trifolium pratense]